MNFNFKTKILGCTLALHLNKNKAISGGFLLAPTPSEETHGMTSRCRDGRHIILLDFDGLTETEVIEEIRYLQEAHKGDIAEALLFGNDRPDSFHCVILEKFTLYEAVNIVSQTSADKGFKRAPFAFKKKRWVLREEGKGEREKPKYLGVIPSKWACTRERSRAHREFLEANYGIGILHRQEDGFTLEDMDFCEYNTAANVKKQI